MPTLTSGQLDHYRENGYILVEDLLDPATDLNLVLREHGCIERVAGNRCAGLLHHCQGAGFGLYIQDEHIDQDRIFTAEMKRGDMLFMHRRTCHSSLPNISNEVRISFDLRYNPSGQPTGRPLFPGFIARSRKDPSRELPPFNRWRSGDPVCA